MSLSSCYGATNGLPSRKAPQHHRYVGPTFPAEKACGDGRTETGAAENIDGSVTGYFFQMQVKLGDMDMMGACNAALLLQFLCAPHVEKPRRRTPVEE